MTAGGRARRDVPRRIEALDVLDVLEVLDGGLLATIQDGGRTGFEPDGVPRSGAADGIGLAVANALLGNALDAAAIEATLLGPRLRALVDVDVALGGADLGAVVAGRRLTPGESIRLRAGEELSFEGRADGPDAGCRAYLAVPGGIAVPLVLGSRSTCLPAALGGFDGRPLHSGDRLAAAGGAVAARPAPRRLPARLAADLPTSAQRLRVLPGPASGAGDPTYRALVDRAWYVAPESDRRGLRLEPAGGPAEGSGLEGVGELPSHGVLPGAIQLTPAGQPLVLLPDAGTTGGYPVVAVVIRADVPLLGQLPPGAEVRFRASTPEAAREAELDRRRFLDAVVAGLTADLP